MEDNINRTGVVSLLISCLSLMLSILPPCVIDNKIKEIEVRNYFDSPAVSLEIKGVKFIFAQLENPDNIDAPLELLGKERKIEKLRRLSAFFTTAMILAAVTAVCTAVYSWSKEYVKEICIGSIISSIVALSWQYIGGGISAGVAAFVFIILVVSFS
ncbi:MAG: hypothetical protein D3924_06210 [Candidatus Electrothrix sp. AR4]|nr:hypothetical protein [Candidatus Electrothrix sp. AR4]